MLLYQLTPLRITGDLFFDVDSGSDPDMPQTNEHFTMIFNTFVSMTLFNELNARKIHGERNVFLGLNNNYIFIGIWIATVVAQVCRHEAQLNYILVNKFALCVMFSQSINIHILIPVYYMQSLFTVTPTSSPDSVIEITTCKTGLKQNSTYSGMILEIKD
jgi:Cation transporting ATPase, C-terminus